MARRRRRVGSASTPDGQSSSLVPMVDGDFLRFPYFDVLAFRLLFWLVRIPISEEWMSRTGGREETERERRRRQEMSGEERSRI